jgi:hypothetical protein
MKTRIVSALIAAALALGVASACAMPGVPGAAPSPGPGANYSYYHLGQNIGADLRLGIISWGEFVRFLQAYIVSATPLMANQFRAGFLSGYGFDAPWVLRAGLEAARY